MCVRCKKQLKDCTVGCRAEGLVDKKGFLID